ncbi:uncharacterized protein LOC116250234 isoform X1 [Nymphaea colorata]|uniref:uncharacterized protein LOC116250234 isoform X1 n=2 Tax=Nymphaea colorata TaxID=210225 RepID=UPI00129ED020|nr:uncharacterized protein LOC116250234 isoform X1 [Nymphaea colorata]XP_031479638.1 uncharacterized protein LOC116250234 isoform X1 [Nymphaea colorata]
MAPSTFQELELLNCSLNLEEVMLDRSWEDVLCPICLDFPHNGVLLCCSSYKKGCRPFICDTDCAHSNCLDRFKSAYGMSEETRDLEALGGSSSDSSQSTTPRSYDLPLCPLCRGEVMGWIIINEVRTHLDAKERFCAEENCKFCGNYAELRKHMVSCHPLARPSEVDPARKLEWENFQRSSELIDVLNTIHLEVPNGVVLGDYVIEYAENETADDYDDYHGYEGNRWTSCFVHQVFDPIFNFRGRNRRRSGSRGTRSHGQQWEDASGPPEDATGSVGYSFRVSDEFVQRDASARSHRRSRRRHRSRVQDN